MKPLLAILLAVVVGCGKTAPAAPAPVAPASVAPSRPVAAAPAVRVERIHPEVPAAPKSAGLPATPKGTGPTQAQVEKDLIGQTFWYDLMTPRTGGKKWRIVEGEIVGTPEIRDRLTDSAAGTEEVEVFLTLKSGEPEPTLLNRLEPPEKITIRGVLVMVYKKFDQGWRLQNVWPKAGGRPVFPSTDWGNKPFTWKMSK